MTVSPPFVKGINLGGDVGVVIEGNRWLSHPEALAAGLTVLTGTAGPSSPFTPTPQPDAETARMLASNVWTSGTVVALNQTLANGDYDVYVWIAEDGPAYSRNLNLKLEGVVVATGIGELPAGGWKKYGPYPASVRDGVLNIEVVQGTKGTPQLMGLAIFTRGGGTLTGETNQAPTANAGGPYTGSVGQAIQFDGSRSTDADGSIASYAWDFGDGSTGSGVNPTHAYAAAGTYTVTLTVTDNAGASSTATATVTVTERIAFISFRADSVFDETINGVRYYFPASGVGDRVVPVPTDSDRGMQWLSARNRPMNGSGTLSTPINLYITFDRTRTVRRIRIYQSAYDGTAAFHTKAFRVYLRRAGGSWTQVASGSLANSNGAMKEFNLSGTVADELRIRIDSSYDLTYFKAVGLAEVEAFGS